MRPKTDTQWWRDAVIYQVYPRSFQDTTGTGIGDIPGVTSRLEHLRKLGVDALWLSPFYPSPLLDGGYDVSDYCDVDPRLGTLSNIDELVTRAHDHGIKVIIDLVPNHCSWEHPLFKKAIAAGPGSSERELFIFKEGRGQFGEKPPTDWVSGAMPAWTRITEADGTPGPWYLHLFDISQPDWNWRNPEVWCIFDEILRFWLDRGVDGFRVDVSHGLMKNQEWPDWNGLSFGLIPTEDPETRPPFWDQDEVHEVYRHWRGILNEYPGERILVAEAWLTPRRLSRYVRADEMHQAFNFAFLECPWNANELRKTVTETLSESYKVGAPATWVLSNHDVIRHATRLGYPVGTTLPFGIGPDDPEPDNEMGLRRARAATAFMLALPGSAYLYQGEELGLPEAINIPDIERQDPHWIRSQGALRGRDGCRVPIPWTAEGPGYGFTQGKPWLTIPSEYGRLAVEKQWNAPESTLSLYHNALRLREQCSMGNGSVEWIEGMPQGVVAFRNGNIMVVTNTSPENVVLPSDNLMGRIVLNTSVDITEPAQLSGDSTWWMELPSSSITVS